MRQRDKLHHLPSIRRLPRYLHLLKNLQRQGEEFVSAPRIGDTLGLPGIQVRKDLALTGIVGKPRVGYDLDALVEAIETHLGWNHVRQAVLAGVGSLGTALLGYGGFNNFGLEIKAAFDSSPAVIGRDVRGRTVKPIRELTTYVLENSVRIGILTVPPQAAQEVAEMMVQGGVEAIWNFVPAPLTVPEQVIVQHEDLACGLGVLSLKLELRDGNGNH
jgi:redox-sensing transcriptional repressor